MLSETSLFDKNAKCNETEWGEEHPTNDRYMPYGPRRSLLTVFCHFYGLRLLLCEMYTFTLAQFVK
ncbi:hypothetical protein AG1IA_06246 [Rhizoctonia solani AG-1 IA]|uniref:Uncharacterized protein n=1 Tax=Thanatephorus cucumeris (strain AG1-IA) TaxID=983506 RepID=L8WSK0_THACA|nr:hypothetical protein AG1IA_06246 [Rhizoctonia solani AG-1 IA]